MKIDPEFRFKICGVREETPYDTSKYQMQPNPELPEAGGVKLAANEKEVLLLELFPMVAKTFLTDMKVKAYAAAKPAEPKAEEKKAEEVKKIVITGNAVTAPAARPHHRTQGQSGRYGQGRRRDRSPGGHENGEFRDDRLRRHGKAGAGTAGENVATDAVLVEIG